jgi:hypothetical protein
MSSIDTIKIDDKCSYREINQFLACEDPKDQCPGKGVVSQVEKYDFVSNLPPCLKGKERFSSIGHDLEQAIGKNEVPIVDYIPRQSAITPVHCDNCLDWI